MLSVVFLLGVPKLFPVQDPIISKDNIISIAVLPFNNFSSIPEHEHLCIGMTNAVISRLAKIEAIDRVISMTTIMRFQNSEKSLPEIAAELNVTHILESSFQKSGDDIKVTLRLMDGLSESDFWNEVLEEEWADIFVLEANVAEEVARNIGVRLSEGEIATIRQASTTNEEAYDLYLQSLFHARNNWGAHSAHIQDKLERAISLDSSFADAYAQLGYYWMTQIIWDSDPKANYEDCLAKTRYYLDHALASNPENDLAHILYGFTHMFFEQDFETARRFFLKGLELRPSSFNKQLVASTFLNALGELEFADSLLTQAMAESPLDPGVSAGRALVDFFAGRILQARQTLNTNIKLIKEGNSTSVAARIYFGLQDYQQVISILTEYLAERPEKRPPLILAYLAAAYYKVGEVTEVNKLLRELKEIHLHTKIGSPAFYTALVYSQMGEVDIAFELLDKAISNREIELYWLKVESPFEPLREDHRWQDALDAVGFPKKI